ncbi:MAG: ATP-grasp domain-containing protein [Patescibacteria group bacterium]
MKTLIIYGGFGLSSEAEVSIKSGEALLQAMPEAKGFLLTKDNLPELLDTASQYDIVIPALHGNFGEDGQLQTLLEERGINFIGSGSAASALCWDKFRYKEAITKLGKNTPASKLITTISNLPQSGVLKPIGSGSSIDMLITKPGESFNHSHVQTLLDKYQTLLWEEYIEGIEITVGILKDQPLPVVEIIPPENSWFDYQHKYDGTTQELVPAIHISEDIQHQAQQIALTIHTQLGCKDISRTDMIVKGDTVYVLETNTMPGLTPESLYPKAANAAGYKLHGLISYLIDFH